MEPGRDDRPAGPPDWAIRLWPVWLLAGAALIVVGILLHTNPAKYGGPVVIGVILILGGLVCARRRFGAPGGHE